MFNKRPFQAWKIIPVDSVKVEGLQTRTPALSPSKREREIFVFGICQGRVAHIEQERGQPCPRVVNIFENSK